MTVEELLEIEEIKQLRIMYSHYLDGGDLEGLVGLFCEDAVCEFGENYGGDWVGRETIRKNYSSYTSDEIKPFSMFMHAVNHHAKCRDIPFVPNSTLSKRGKVRARMDFGFLR